VKPLNRRKRLVIAVVGVVTLFCLGFGMIGYYAGLGGVGYGWPAFFAVAGIALGTIAAIALATAVLLAAIWWVSRGSGE
jgi:hypothetical protein